MSATKQNLTKLQCIIFASAILFLSVLPACCLTLQTQASGLNSRSLQLLNSTPGATTDYILSFTISNTSALGSIGIVFCSNSPLPDDYCAPPVGIDVTNATLSNQSGIGDFTFFGAAPNYILLSRSPTIINAPLTVTYVFSGIINPTAAGAYYARVSAYSSTDATGVAVDFGGIAFAITNNLQISSVVPPYLIFCTGLVINNLDCASASGDYINFGELSSVRSSQASSQMMVATNAAGGYVIQVYGTTMTSGNNILNAITNEAVSRPGTSQFGINLRANTSPAIGADPVGPGMGQPTPNYNNPDHYQFVSNDTLVSALSADNYRKYTVSYIVNTPSSQPPGVYASTLTYVCAGSF